MRKCALLRSLCMLLAAGAAGLHAMGRPAQTDRLLPAPVPPLPSPQQVTWQQMETYAFIHFGPNTFGDREWGYGDAPASTFNPSRLDCDQWVRVLKAAGMKGVIITAKHHDGFCLWPSRYTDYSVRNSPWRQGKGDVVGELAAACRRHGLRMGVYLSPWDRHQATYGTPLYVEYFHAQLEELLTGYGPLFEVWFDGANGGDGWYGGACEKRQIDRRSYYDLPRAFERVAALQPEAVIFSDGGPGCRWVGNERGHAGATNWSFLRRGEVYPGYPRYQELTEGHADGDMWVAAECDVSIRPGWFYHRSEDSLVKSADELCKLYYQSVGHGATLLLNFPVNDEGLISPADSAQAVDFYRRIRAELSDNLLQRARVTATPAYNASSKDLTIATSGGSSKGLTKVLTDDDYSTFWAAAEDSTTATLTFTFRHPQEVNRLCLQEYIPLGQRVRAFKVEYLSDKEWRDVPAGEPTTTIGYKRLLRFPTLRTRALRVTVTDARGPVCLSGIGAYRAPDKVSNKAGAGVSDKAGAESAQTAPADPEQRVAALLKQMTLREKVGQLRCAMAWDYYTTDAQGRIIPSETFKRDVADGSIGMLWATFRADPWTRKTLTNGLTPRRAAEAANVLQRYAIEHSRLGIPLLLAEEAPHGHMAIGTTVFPTGLGMAATWSEELMERAGEVIAREIRLQGAHISYGPVLDLATDPRWSRVEETLGEDPVLTAALGAAMVRGLGSREASPQGGTLATLKHFVAYGSSEGGQNGGHTQMGPRQLAQRFLPPFRKAIEAGAKGVMTAYNAVDAVPCTANATLLTDMLRHEWGFGGLVVSDLYAIDGLAGTHHVASDRTGAAAKALQAGVDIDLGASAYARLGEAVAQGLVDEALIDSAVARVLRQKIALGLFEQPYVDPDATRQVHSAAHRQVALDMARASVTLLKNEHGVLPLQPTSRVLVCGPNADNVYNQLGDYTAPQPEGAVTTVLAALRQQMPAQQVDYVKGCSVRDTASNHIAQAVAAAQQADVIIACVGGSSARDFRTSYASTGAAATTSAPSDMECGEGFDRASLELMGLQLPLLQALKATGKPLVVIYIEGRPLDKRWAAQHADALLTAYYPGEAGGTAIADVLLGRYNPAGRLPVSTPATVGQLPVYYNRLGTPHDYVEESAQPLYPFGYGLSYTTFAYSSLQVEPADDGALRVSIDVTNTGQRDGDEVVQLYLRHETASVAMPRKQLKAFRRLFIPRGQTRPVTFNLRPDDFAIVNERLQRVVEPGLVTILIGDLKQQIQLPYPSDK